MGMSGREVTEYVAPDVRLWLIYGPGRLSGVAAAVKSPLTGQWLVTIGGSKGQEHCSWRSLNLREARRSVLGGNGRQRGGHCEVMAVRQESLPGTLHRIIDII